MARSIGVPKALGIKKLAAGDLIGRCSCGDGIRLKISTPAARCHLRRGSEQCAPTEGLSPPRTMDVFHREYLFGLFLRRRDSKRVEQVAQQIAWQCRYIVCSRVGQKTVGMGPDQVKGYVRAHAASVAKAKADTVLQKHHVHSRLRPEVVDRATQLLISRAVEHLPGLPLSSRGRMKVA